MILDWIARLFKGSSPEISIETRKQKNGRVKIVIECSEEMAKLLLTGDKTPYYERHQ